MDIALSFKAIIRIAAFVWASAFIEDPSVVSIDSISPSDTISIELDSTDQIKIDSTLKNDDKDGQELVQSVKDLAVINSRDLDSVGEYLMKV